MALAPGFATAHCNLGHARKAQGLQAQAIVHYRRAIALDADAPEHHFSLGLALMEQGRL
ncbi:MAG TPA: glycosyl transferase, partial [Janthinobacterium sp.]|nr:glycosyl transferase [Janthinobacterium sp.]